MLPAIVVAAILMGGFRVIAGRWPESLPEVLIVNQVVMLSIVVSLILSGTPVELAVFLGVFASVGSSVFLYLKLNR
jgi:hypothetical protein